MFAESEVVEPSDAPVLEVLSGGKKFGAALLLPESNPPVPSGEVWAGSTPVPNEKKGTGQRVVDGA